MEEFRSIQNKNNESVSVSKNPDKKKNRQDSMLKVSNMKKTASKIRNTQNKFVMSCKNIWKMPKNLKESY